MKIGKLPLMNIGRMLTSRGGYSWFTFSFALLDVSYMKWNEREQKTLRSRVLRDPEITLKILAGGANLTSLANRVDAMIFERKKG